MDQIIEWKFRLSPLGEINEPSSAIVKTNNKKRLPGISIMIHSPKLSWGGVQKCLKLSRGAEIKIFVSGDKNIWHTRHFGGHVTTGSGKNICNSGRSLKLCRKNAVGQAAAGSRWKPWSIRHFSIFTSPCQLPQTWLTKIHWSFLQQNLQGLLGAWLPLLLAARLTNGFIVAAVRAGDRAGSRPAAPALRVIKPSSDSQIQITIIRTISWHGRRYNDIIRRAKVPKQCFPKVREWIWMDGHSHGLILTTQLEQYHRRLYDMKG